MESWRDSLSKYMESWTSPTKDEEGVRRFEGADVTQSDEEAQLSYPGTDDEEYDDASNSGANERWEDASEDDEEFNPAEAAAEALRDALKTVADAEKTVEGVDPEKKQAYGMPSFRDILLGRKSQEKEEEEDDEEWETDDDEASPDFPELGSKTPKPAPKKASAFSWGSSAASSERPKEEEAAKPSPAEAKAGETSTKSSSSFFKPSLPDRAPKTGPSLPPKRQKTGEAPTATKTEAAEEQASSSAVKKPSLPPRPTLPARKSVEKETKPEPAQGGKAEEEAKASANEAAKGPTTTAYSGQGAAAPNPQQPPSGRAAAMQAMIKAQQEAAAAAAAAAAEPLSPEKQKLADTVMEHRVKLVRIAKRLGVGADNHVIKQVIFRLDMTEQVKLHGRSSRVALKETFKEAEEKAAAMEESGEDLDLECTVLIIGKSGVGKSTLVNNLLGIDDDVVVERHSGKTQVREIEGEAFGVKMRFIDVPGLQPSRSESKKNRKILQAAKRITKKHMPDIVLYCDRLDVPSYDFADIPLVRDISNTFGASIWWNALIVFTHGGSRAPEDSTGQIANFEYFQNHRGYIVQQMIRQAAGDARILNPVSVVECHHATKRNEKGEKLLPSGQAWKTYILLLCYASKVLHDANVALKLDNDMKDNKAAKNAQYAAFRRQQTPYPLFFNNLFQTRKPRRYQNIVDEEEAAEIEAEQEEMDAMPGQEKDYPLNPFKQPLDQGDSRIDIPAPDPALAPTFDCDPSTNAHRYRYLENSNGWICRAIVEPDGLEHDDGINGFTAENYYGTMADPTSKDPKKKNPTPTYVMSQINMPEKDKLTLVAEIESSKLHKGKNSGAPKSKGGPPVPETSKPPVTTGGIDVQSLGRDIMYVARAETRVKQGEKMKTCAGVSAFRSSLKFPHTGPLAFGAKVEERIKLNKKLRLNMTAGAIGGKAADGKTNQYLKGANVQFMIKGNKKKGEPTKLQVIGTAMHWKKDIALGGDIQAIQMVGPDSALTARANLNSRGSGSVQLRLTSTDTIKYGLVGLVPTVTAIWGFLTGNM